VSHKFGKLQNNDLTIGLYLVAEQYPKKRNRMLRKTDISTLASAVLLLASLQGCTADADDVTSQTGHTEMIEFLPLVEETPAAFGAGTGTAGVTTTRNIREFKVSAIYRGQYNFVTLLDNVIVRRVGQSNKWEYSPKIDWPGPAVNFYMVSPINTNMHVINYGDGRGALLDKYINTGKIDLVVAADYDEVAHPGPVRVNFRHALTRIEASIRPSLPEGYDLMVKMVYATGVPLEGSYTWPTESTNIQNSGDIGDTASSGRWVPTGYATHSNYTFRLLGNIDSDGVILKNDGEYGAMKGTGIQFLIPNELEESRYAEAHWLGANLMVVYRIVKAGTEESAWPIAGETPEEYLFNEDKTWAIQPFPLREATPDNRWRSGINYHYRMTLNAPEALRGKTRSLSGEFVMPRMRIEVEQGPY